MFVLKGALPEMNELENDVHYVLSTVTYLKWGKKWFWENLKYVLHERTYVSFKQHWSFREVRHCFKKQDDTNSDISLETRKMTSRKS